MRLISHFFCEFLLFFTYKRVYNLQIRDFYLLLLNRGCDLKTLKVLFEDVDEKLALKVNGMRYYAKSQVVQQMLEETILQEQRQARMDCFRKLYEKGLDIFEVLELLGISSKDMEMLNDAAYVWQDIHL